MNTSHPAFGLLQLARAARDYPRRWAVPAVVVAVVVLIFAVFRADTWQASQALIVRNEAAGEHSEPGNFDHAEQMKAVQETILELAKSQSVLRGALIQAGIPEDYDREPSQWPTDRDVAGFRKVVSIDPPKGTEFGTTEVFYLTVKNQEKARAIALTKALCDQLETRFQEIRDAKAQSMIGELANAVRLAQVDLDQATTRLSAIEKEVGPDLAELRILNDATNGDSTLRRTVGEIATELRQARSGQATNQELLTLLQQAQKDQGQLLAAPNQLLESQPALRRLKDGLVDAQINTAQLKGRMNDAHPLVKAARESEKEIGRHLYHELDIAIRGVKADLRLTADRIRLLEERLAEVTGRLERLAELRTPYANHLAVAAHRTHVLQQAERQLSQARAAQASASETNLISRIDAPDAGTKPLGPSRAIIVLCGIAGGLMVGFGILFIAAPPVVVTNSNETSRIIEPIASPEIEPITDEPAVATTYQPTSPRPVSTSGSLTAALSKLNGNGQGSVKV